MDSTNARVYVISSILILCLKTVTRSLLDDSQPLLCCLKYGPNNLLSKAKYKFSGIFGGMLYDATFPLPPTFPSSVLCNSCYENAVQVLAATVLLQGWFPRSNEHRHFPRISGELLTVSQSVYRPADCQKQLSEQLISHRHLLELLQYCCRLVRL